MVTMQRAVTTDILVEVRQAIAPWLDGGAHDAVLRLRDGFAQYAGSYIVFDYHWDGEEVSMAYGPLEAIKGIFRRRTGKP